MLRLSLIRIIAAGAVVLVLVGVLSPVQAQSESVDLAPTSGISSIEQVRNFHSDITFNQDSSIRIKETIQYFFPEPRHGIFRKIPVNYKAFSLFRRSTQLQLHSVKYFATDKPTQVKGDYEKSNDFGYLTIKIGDADVTVTGNYTYVIDYTLRYAVNYFDDHDELFLNVTGNYWDVPIAKSSAAIHLPVKPTKWVCYTGMVDTKDEHCTWKEVSENTLDVVSQNTYAPGEGLTVAVALPKDSIANTTQQQLWLAILANLGCLLPIPFGIFAFILWWLHGRDPQAGTVIPLYHAPKDLSPLAAGFLYSQSQQPKHLSAEIIDLAIKGYLKINQLGNRKYEFVRLNKSTETLTTYQQTLLAGLFKKGDTVTTSDLKDKFYTTVQTVNKLVQEQVKKQGAFEKGSEVLKIVMILAGVGVFIAAAASMTVTVDWGFVGWSIGLGASGFITALFGFFMTKRSRVGNAEYTELEGVKLYIKTAEQHRIEFHNNPKKAIRIFEELLPYAMIFNLEKQWAKEFEDLYTQQPEWYGGNFTTFHATHFAQDIGQMNSAMTTIAAPTSASGGSGFSGGGGGGFGGGGGGSW